MRKKQPMSRNGNCYDCGKFFADCDCKSPESSCSDVSVLRLNLKRKWWEQIRDGEKTTELRRVTDFWRKRLVGRDYDEIHLCLGYPKKGDDSRVLKRKWKGHFVATIKHEEFGVDPVDVFCIDVATPII